MHCVCLSVYLSIFLFVCVSIQSTVYTNNTTYPHQSAVGDMMLPDKSLPSILALLHLGLSVLVHVMVATLKATRAGVRRKLSYVGM